MKTVLNTSMDYLKLVIYGILFHALKILNILAYM